ncbi:signal peptidase I [Breznakia sp. PF5-3]|uniref:signal peptidase I n=1 Tax=unclassified Breznakia TaxID=2623764 RepID=UPI002405670E|nr:MULTISPECIES: signal peptidase I [unclassified Breznakia]MDF9824227.1 signal peptidase I [Breznakia sp. PM6-1]MDF9835025.1 signal peptidase I [Breznakia sp. PF5-3]MDF9837270.1 signal peptidase I [Breznakia sp. PFB2-8]MDF9859260.1 signal peptidase I [Breznakia sp. PH5-24]
MKKLRIRSEYVIFILRMFVIFSVLVFVVTTFIFRTVRINGQSMEPTLQSGEYAFSNRLAADEGNINRFDVIVIDNIEEDYVVKRVIALPNETISYKDGKLYINGEWYEEPFLDQEYIALHTMNNQITFTQNFGPITLGENEYFVLGDNRLNSKDSRVVGPIPEKDIVAKDVIVVYPLNSIRVESSN